MSQRSSRHFTPIDPFLRLPSNLNTQGIVPYGPPADYVPRSALSTTEDQSTILVDLSAEPHHRSHQSSNVVSTLSSKATGQRASLAVQTTTGPVKLGIPSTAPPHPLPPRPMSVSSSSASPSTSMPQGQANSRPLLFGSGNASNPSSSLPNDPIPGLQGQLSTASGAPLQSKPTKSPSYSIKDVPKHGYSGNLDEIETLRRQELQARKAVLASRKPKLGTSSNINKRPSTPGPSSVNTEDARKTTHLSLAKPPTRPSSAISEQKSLVPVEIVDDFLKSITSVSGADSVSGDNAARHTLVHSPDSMDMDIDSNPPRDGPTPGASRGTPWNSADAPFASSSLSSTDSQSTSGQQRSFPSRNGSMKRPVASDFVDYDPATSDGPTTTTTAAYNGGSNGHSRGTSAFTPSFANLASTRKLVIDFSDTEDEEDGTGVTGQQEDGHYHPSRNPVVPSVSSSTGTSASNAPTPESVSPALSLGVTPQALLLKEQEIKRMKELIAEREKNRLNKLANPVRSIKICSIFWFSP